MSIPPRPDVEGLHHVTAICGDPASNRAFHVGALGLRMVKRTVNFDDPTAWHLYYGDELGSAGSAMTYFAWADSPAGRTGAGQVATVRYAVPPGALDFWAARLPRFGATLLDRAPIFGAPALRLADPDGLPLALVETDDPRAPWTTDEIGPDVAIRGFQGVALALREGASTARILTEALGYAEIGREAPASGASLIRFGARRGAAGPAGVVDLAVDPSAPYGRSGRGTVHHVAFSTPDAASQLRVRARLAMLGLQVTEPIDRTYFTAIYARTPGGVLFEVATDGPGFDVDEPRATLGEALALPPQHAPMRARIIAALPPLD
ncbi:MAG: ring-cleaving dioxygenase [Rubrimonas sp.]|uniref:ring-cleaving dioxygenase n=1 Tax=Rubrimonas sp. TaxID=2036015 RepID=UPI002FDD22D8